MRRALIVPAIAAVALTVTACGGQAANNSTGPAATGIKSTTVGQYGTLPAAQGTPTNGGTLTYGIINGSQPNWIMPITPDQDFDVANSEFQGVMDESLLNNEVSDRPRLDYSISLANQPVYSDGNKTVTISLKHGYTWSNGAPVDANDVMFFIDLVKQAVKESAANWGPYTPGDIPDDLISMSAPNKYTVVLHLSKAFNPNWFTETQLVDIVPMPSTSWDITSTGGKPVDWTQPANAKAIYDYLDAQAKDISTYGTNPLWKDVDGPYQIASFNPSTDENTQVANAKYTGPNKPHIQKLQAIYFASSTAEFNQLRSGTLDLGSVDSGDLPQVPTIENDGYHVWGYPGLGFNYIVWNFKDTTNNWNHIIAQLYIRQALDHLQNQPAIIKGVFDGAAAPAYGPVPAVPQTDYVPDNATNNPYPYSVSDASQLLSSHGWHVVPGGTTTCVKPGTATDECGAGIPMGQNLNFTCYYASDPASVGEEVSAVAGPARQVGINITPVAKTFNFIIQNYDDPVLPADNNDWAAEDYGGFTLGDYPTTDTIFNSKGDDNEGGWNDPKVNQLINASKFSANPQAVRNEASYITTQLPAIFQPNADAIYAWKNISGPPDTFANLTQFGFSPQYWWMTPSSS